MGIDPKQAPQDRVDPGPDDWSAALVAEPAADDGELGLSGHPGGRSRNWVTGIVT